MPRSKYYYQFDFGDTKIYYGVVYAYRKQDVRDVLNLHYLNSVIEVCLLEGDEKEILKHLKALKASKVPTITQTWHTSLIFNTRQF